jgi:hypothetical protein
MNGREAMGAHARGAESRADYQIKRTTESQRRRIAAHHGTPTDRPNEINNLE